MKRLMVSRLALCVYCGAGISLLVPSLAFTGWVPQTSGTSNTLNAVLFPVDDQTGYAVGYSGTILKTTNGGVNWGSQNSDTANFLISVDFPVDARTGYAVGRGGTILKTTGGGSGVEGGPDQIGKKCQTVKAAPNPFISFTILPGHETERFNLYDFSGRIVGVYKGDRIGQNLTLGVYFPRENDKNTSPVRIVKIR